MKPFSLYIHFPFCVKRCGYCDFNTTAGQLALVPAYLHALEAELAFWRTQLDPAIPFHTVYVGGGTPSLMEPDQLARLLEAVRAAFNLDDAAEVSLEANPGTLTAVKASGFSQAGVNRISLGVQSAVDEDLAMLGRIHSLDEAQQAYAACRDAGVRSINIDFIYGLPGQRLQDWQRTLEIAVGLQPNHLSLYALTLEQGTPMTAQYAAGELPEIDPDTVADQYAYAMSFLGGHGYAQYEISNWAFGNNNEHRCRHNLQYWRNLPYLGLGAGAHGYVNGQRYSNVAALTDYLEKAGHASAIERSRGVSQDERMQDEMMLGLRLVQEGVSRASFFGKFGIYPEQRFPREIRRLRQRGLLTYAHDRDALILTPEARGIANQVFMEFVGDS